MLALLTLVLQVPSYAAPRTVSNSEGAVSHRHSHSNGHPGAHRARRTSKREGCSESNGGDTSGEGNSSEGDVGNSTKEDLGEVDPFGIGVLEGVVVFTSEDTVDGQSSEGVGVVFIEKHGLTNDHLEGVVSHVTGELTVTLGDKRGVSLDGFISFNLVLKGGGSVNIVVKCDSIKTTGTSVSVEGSSIEFALTAMPVRVSVLSDLVANFNKLVISISNIVMGSEEMVEEIILGTGSVTEESDNTVSVLHGDAWDIPHGVHELDLRLVRGVKRHF